MTTIEAQGLSARHVTAVEERDQLSDLLSHIENNLGYLSWAEKDESIDVKVACFSNSPWSRYNTYVTLGLSEYPLQMEDGREVRQEILYSCIDGVKYNWVPSILFNISEYLVRDRTALLRGQIIGPLPEHVFRQNRYLYVSIPSIYPEKMRSFETRVGKTVFVWLFLLYENEARFIKEAGWDIFESRLELQNLDLLDLNRAPLSV